MLAEPLLAVCQWTNPADLAALAVFAASMAFLARLMAPGATPAADAAASDLRGAPDAALGDALWVP